MPALDHRLIRLEALPDGFRTEVIETVERGQAGRGVGGGPSAGVRGGPNRFRARLPRWRRRAGRGLVVGQSRQPGIRAHVTVGEVLAGSGPAVGDEQRTLGAVLDQAGQ
ncbi:hypothetical protein [Nocardia australiensis]|uniref:hypothetical protein n=1 Tax=Nocardia australiensis TaxID=2887191 RepID=UPI001D1480D1|nr:hypothetical protein [Nocardia australiensis]